MTLAEFNKLDHKKRSDIVWEWAYYISKRDVEKYNVVLFLMNDFFVEVYINSSNNKTENILGVSKSELHKDYTLSLKQKDPLVKSVLMNPGPPFIVTAA